MPGRLRGQLSEAPPSATSSEFTPHLSHLFPDLQMRACAEHLNAAASDSHHLEGAFPKAVGTQSDAGPRCSTSSFLFFPL